MKTKLLLTLIFCALISFAFAQSDVLSSKQNIPAKKETFTGKLDRYKTDGFKVAVILVSGPIKTKVVPPSSTTMVSKNITLEGELPAMDKDLAPLVESFTATMNESFGTDVFEIVDESSIPKMESKWGEITDWGVTKYKMVVSYAASPVYDYTFNNNKYEATFSIGLNVTATEFVNEKKGVKMKYPIRVGNLGFYKSPAYSTETDPGFKTIEELHAVVNPPSGAEITGELQKEMDGKMDDFIAKRKK